MLLTIICSLCNRARSVKLPHHVKLTTLGSDFNMTFKIIKISTEFELIRKLNLLYITCAKNFLTIQVG